MLVRGQNFYKTNFCDATFDGAFLCSCLDGASFVGSTGARIYAGSFKRKGIAFANLKDAYIMGSLDEIPLNNVLIDGVTIVSIDKKELEGDDEVTNIKKLIFAKIHKS
jgi:hypothetical protein